MKVYIVLEVKMIDIKKTEEESEYIYCTPSLLNTFDVNMIDLKTRIKGVYKNIEKAKELVEKLPDHRIFKEFYLIE
jgi:hypothetical protein